MEFREKRPCSRCRRVKDNIQLGRKMCEDCRNAMKETREKNISYQPKMYKDYLKVETNKNWLEKRKKF